MITFSWIIHKYEGTCDNGVWEMVTNFPFELLKELHSATPTWGPTLSHNSTIPEVSNPTKHVWRWWPRNNVHIIRFLTGGNHRHHDCFEWRLYECIYDLSLTIFFPTLHFFFKFKIFFICYSFWGTKKTKYCIINKSCTSEQENEFWPSWSQNFLSRRPLSLL